MTDYIISFYKVKFPIYFSIYFTFFFYKVKGESEFPKCLLLGLVNRRKTVK